MIRSDEREINERKLMKMLLDLLPFTAASHLSTLLLSISLTKNMNAPRRRTPSSTSEWPMFYPPLLRSLLPDQQAPRPSKRMHTNRFETLQQEIDHLEAEEEDWHVQVKFTRPYFALISLGCNANKSKRING